MNFIKIFKGSIVILNDKGRYVQFFKFHGNSMKLSETSSNYGDHLKMNNKVDFIGFASNYARI